MSKETNFVRRMSDFKPGGAVWLKREVERITKKYKYLDDIKELRGWMWEFIRRSKRYNILFRFIELTFANRSEAIDTIHLLDAPECADIVQWIKNETLWFKNKSRIPSNPLLSCYGIFVIYVATLFLPKPSHK